MAKDEEDGGKILMGCALIIIMIPVGIVLKGFVLCQLWGWFVVPFGLMAISMPHALGLSTCIALFHGIHTGGKTPDDQTMGQIVGKAFGSIILVPLFIWGIGWIFHYFM